MNCKLPLARAALCAGMLSASGGASAWQDGAMGVYGGLGHGSHRDGSRKSTSAGLLIPWTGWTPWSPGAGTTWSVDLFASHWRAPRNLYDRGDNSYSLIGAAAIWRHRLSQGSSPWFVEASLGLTFMDRLYITPERGFGTRLNFVSQLGVGRSFGGDGRHEVSLRVQHYSNAGIRSPNPGEDLVQLRYAWRF